MIEKSLLEALWIPFEIFLIVVLIAVGVHNSNQTPIQDITKAYTEKACTQGGFSNSDIQNLKNDLAKEDITDVTINITPANAQPTKYQDNCYVKRGEIINLEIINNKLGLIDQVYKSLGSKTDIKNRAKAYGMSERR